MSYRKGTEFEIQSLTGWRCNNNASGMPQPNLDISGTALSFRFLLRMCRMFKNSSARRKGKSGLWAGATLVFAVSTSSAAFANCNGTGAFAVGGLTPFLPFAGGSAVSALTSAINAVNTSFLTQSTAFVSAPPNPRPNQEGGGVWVRGIGGENTIKSTSTTSNVVINGAPLDGGIACANQTNVKFAGVQAGTDIATLNYGGGWNLHIGTTVGYLGAKTSDNSGQGPLDPQGGTLTNKMEVPFAGVYVVATKGSFFMDGQIRTDFYQNSINDPFISGAFDQKLDARGLAFSGNVGYNMPLQNNWFIEPSAGIVVSRVKVDPFNVAGSVVLPNSFTTNVTFPGTLRVDDIKNTIGRLSLRAGTSFTSNNVVWQPFAVASVFHDFDGKVTSRFDSNPFANTVAIFAPGFFPLGFPRFTGNVSATGIGTYGQIGVGVAGQIVNTGWLGYIRGDYRHGDNIDGYSINGGIRYQFTPDMPSAKPLYAKAPALKAPAIVAPYDWTGFFVGASGGALNGRTDWFLLNTETATNPRFAGALGGLQVGYDHQFGKWVVGVEGNINATNAHGSRPCPPPADSLLVCEDGVNWIGTATARLGYAFWDRSIVYGRAGVAFDESKIQLSCTSGPFNTLGLPNCYQKDTQTRVGWTVGFGSEFALTKNWTVRSETNYYDMGSKRFTVPPGNVGFPVPTDVGETGFITTIGLNYRFAPGAAVIARY
jgi:outer membrane autotransporter protein